MTGDLDDTSFLHLLFLVHAHGSINNLFSIEKGGQDSLVDGGAGSIARRVADELGDAVRLNSPVRAVTQRDDHVLVEAGELTVSVRHVVSTIPPELALEIAFEPALPDDRVAVPQFDRRARRARRSSFTKSRSGAAGFSGQTSGQFGLGATIDSSPAAGTPGVIASFVRSGCRVQKLDAAERLRGAPTLAGAPRTPRSDPVAFVETAWAEEQWTQLLDAHLQPKGSSRGSVLRSGPALRSVPISGTETSTISHGAIDGAVRSGERAATEILDRA